MLRRIACEGKGDIASDGPQGVLHGSASFQEPVSLSGSKLPPNMHITCVRTREISLKQKKENTLQSG